MLKIIEVDGYKFPAKYIGKGQFSKVYQVGNRVIYYTRGDCGKEVLAMYQYDRIAHLPEIVRHDDIIRSGNRWHVFSSPFYRNVRSTDTSAWKLMKHIIKYVGRATAALYANGFRGYDLMVALVDDMKYSNEFPHSVIKTLNVIIEISGDCGYNVMFDLHKSNFGVNEYGTLIFRDPVYVKGD